MDDPLSSSPSLLPSNHHHHHHYHHDHNHLMVSTRDRRASSITPLSRLSSQPSWNISDDIISYSISYLPILLECHIPTLYISYHNDEEIWPDQEKPPSSPQWKATEGNPPGSVLPLVIALSLSRTRRRPAGTRWRGGDPGKLLLLVFIIKRQLL